MFALPPFDPGIEISAASHGMSKGVSQTDDGQFIAKLFVAHGDVQAGTQWKNVSQSGASGEFSAFLNVSHRFGALQLTGGGAYKISTGAKPGWDQRSLELNAAATRKLGRFSLRVGGIYSPDDLGPAGQSLYVEGGPSFDLDKGLRISANVGRRERDGAPDYTAFNAGVTKTVFKRLSLDARYYRTDRTRLGSTYRDRLVLTARLGI
jgi:hypothetical protein